MAGQMEREEWILYDFIWNLMSVYAYRDTGAERINKLPAGQHHRSFNCPPRFNTNHQGKKGT
jgi:hypothetical protein